LEKTLLQIEQALMRGNRIEALTILASLVPPTASDEPSELIPFIENLLLAHNPETFEELWMLLYDPELPDHVQICTKAEARDVVEQLGWNLKLS
jgi:hypothetical protein